MIDLSKNIEIDEKMDQALTFVCDAALKYCGLQAVDSTKLIIEKVREACGTKENP